MSNSLQSTSNQSASRGSNEPWFKLSPAFTYCYKKSTHSFYKFSVHKKIVSTKLSFTGVLCLILSQTTGSLYRVKKKWLLQRSSAVARYTALFPQRTYTVPTVILIGRASVHSSASIKSSCFPFSTTSCPAFEEATAP